MHQNIHQIYTKYTPKYTPKRTKLHRVLKCSTSRGSVPSQILIPGKLIKEGADFLCKPIQSLINKCNDTCTFPNALNLADVVPIFKKK